MENIPNSSNTYAVRPQNLSFLCVLSFIGSGLSLFSNMMIFLIFPNFLEILSTTEMEAMPTFDPKILLDFVQAAGRVYFLLSAFLYFISITGVYYMWHLRKIGIHFYAVSQLVLLILPLIFIDSSLSFLPGLLLSGVFILLYSRFLNIMK